MQKVPSYYQDIQNIHGCNSIKIKHKICQTTHPVKIEVPGQMLNTLMEAKQQVGEYASP